MKRIITLFFLTIFFSSNTVLVLASPRAQSSSVYQSDYQKNFSLNKNTSNQNKPTSVIPFYIKTGLILGVFSFGCLYYYGLYKGVQFAVEKVPTLFSSLTNFVKTNSTKFINSDSIKKG